MKHSVSDFNNYQDKHFTGEWNIFRNENYAGKLTVEKTGETYKCIWKTIAQPSEYYIGLGMLVGNQLVVSRVKLKNEKDSLPEGGIGIYRPIGDNRSNSALWAQFKNFDTLGSGIAVREETGTSLEGSYKVRYFLKEHESPNFDLMISKKESTELYNLTWTINNSNIAQHGIGMMLNEEMALAWGETKANWDLVVLKLQNRGDKYYLTSSCSTQSKDSIFQEVLHKIQYEKIS